MIDSERETVFNQFSLYTMPKNVKLQRKFIFTETSMSMPKTNAILWRGEAVSAILNYALFRSA
jgi:hypothetical protein